MCKISWQGSREELEVRTNIYASYTLRSFTSETRSCYKLTRSTKNTPKRLPKSYSIFIPGSGSLRRGSHGLRKPLTTWVEHYTSVGERGKLLRLIALTDNEIAYLNIYRYVEVVLGKWLDGVYSLKLGEVGDEVKWRDREHVELSRHELCTN